MELEAVVEWLEERLRVGDVPRISDIVRYAQEKKYKLKRKAIVERVQLHPTYMFNMDQHRIKARSNKNRPILGMSLGRLHADIGFFTKSREYETPPRYPGGTIRGL